MIETVEKYISAIDGDPLHRYSSWVNCFKAFSTTEDYDNHVLELAFYLASWGMYRRSSGLLQKNHLIHEESVKILLSETCQKLKCSPDRDVSQKDIEAILEVKSKLANH